MGWTLRPLQLVGDDGGPDVDAAFAVVVAHHSSIGLGGEDTRASVLGLLRSPEADLEGSLLAVNELGEPGGYLLLEVDRPARQVFLDGYTDPGRDPGAELLTEILAAGVDHAGRIVGSQEPAWRVCAGAMAGDHRYVSSLERNGLETVRHFIRMRVDLSAAEVLEAPSWPEGVTIETAATADIRHAVYEVLEEAFRDHWNNAERPFDDWVAYFDSTPEHVDPGQWVLASVDGQPASALLGDLSLAHLGEGHIRELGTLREHRGRGLARSLLLRSFADARSRGWRGVQLSVDSESPTGAVGLYESVGMVPLRHTLAMQREVPRS